MLFQRIYSFFKQTLKEHSSIFLFVFVLFLVGIIFGAIVVNSLSLDQKSDLFTYLTKFFEEIHNGHVVSSKMNLFENFQENLKVFLLIWILGVSLIGVPLILILLFVRGVVIGFTVGFLVNQAGAKGFFLACATVLPHNLINIPLLIFVTGFSILVSIKMIGRQFQKDFQEPMKRYFKLYLLILIVGIIFIFIATIIEIFFSPILMKIIIN